MGEDQGAPHYLHLAADSDDDLRLRQEAIDGYKNLVKETGALFGSRHYRRYDFLFTLSDHIAHFGLEHHESSDDRVNERTLIDPDLERVAASLLTHEFTHSWNGKYRRPAVLATGNYEDPMKGDLLWVYEGLTQYLGDVLAVRSGLETADEFREALAASAATLDYRPGRTWRDLEDTAVAAQILYDASDQWENWRRSVDYYQEGELVWLDADTLIRQKTNNQKSLTDFLHIFLGKGGNTGPLIVPYNFDELCADLNQVLPYDWAKFFRDRVYPDASAGLAGRDDRSPAHVDEMCDQCLDIVHRVFLERRGCQRMPGLGIASPAGHCERLRDG